MFCLFILKLTALLVQDKESKNKQQNEYIGKHNFCLMKTNFCFLRIFPRWIQIRVCYYSCSTATEFFKMWF
jgi:hypothetical protein